MKLIDISRPLDPSISVWPGDRPFEADWTALIREEGSAVNIGAVSMSTHTGTHADAPLHFNPHGTPIDEVDLSVFIGPATVIEIDDAAPIRPEHLPGTDLQPRILFKTPCSNQPPAAWCEENAVLTIETIRHLAEQSVRLVGTDGPSVDAINSKTLPAHHACMEHGIHILEGLHLRDVVPGTYELIAAPLRLCGLDASPVRAVLKQP